MLGDEWDGYGEDGTGRQRVRPAPSPAARTAAALAARRDRRHRGRPGGGGARRDGQPGSGDRGHGVRGRARARAARGVRADRHALRARRAAQLLLPEPASRPAVRRAVALGVQQRRRVRRLPGGARARRVGAGQGHRPVPGVRDRAHRPQRGRVRQARAAVGGADQHQLHLPGQSRAARPDLDRGQGRVVAVLARAARRQHGQPPRVGPGAHVVRVAVPVTCQLQLLDRPGRGGLRPVHGPADRHPGQHDHRVRHQAEPRVRAVHRHLHVRGGQCARPGHPGADHAGRDDVVCRAFGVRVAVAFSLARHRRRRRRGSRPKTSPSASHAGKSPTPSDLQASRPARRRPSRRSRRRRGRPASEVLLTG